MKFNQVLGINLPFCLIFGQFSEVWPLLIPKINETWINRGQSIQFNKKTLNKKHIFGVRGLGGFGLGGYGIEGYYSECDAGRGRNGLRHTSDCENGDIFCVEEWEG